MIGTLPTYSLISTISVDIAGYRASATVNRDGTVFERGAASILSPLRYPGSKRRLAGYIKQALCENDLRPTLFVEPFAGGASVALQLLRENAVEQIGLIEIDPLVASFWQVVFSENDADTAWLIDQVETMPITLEQWYEYKHHIPDSTRERALTCLYLNRTSFSGILAPTVGPLGGKGQLSAYKLDCRFPRQTLVKRIRQASALRDRVAFVKQTSWNEGLSYVRQTFSGGVFYYLDPPFFEKADKLYTYYFTTDEHKALHDCLLGLQQSWLLSYDAVAQVEQMYGVDEGLKMAEIELIYSSSKIAGSRPAREVIITNLAHLPYQTRVWRTKSEWRRSKSGNSKREQNNECY